MLGLVFFHMHKHEHTFGLNYNYQQWFRTLFSGVFFCKSPVPHHSLAGEKSPSVFSIQKLWFLTRDVFFCFCFFFCACVCVEKYTEYKTLPLNTIKSFAYEFYETFIIVKMLLCARITHVKVV